MAHLPVIVGFGGYNAAGRSSFHHGFRRTVIDSLPIEQQQETLCGLAVLMKLVQYQEGRYIDLQGAVLSEDDVAKRYRQQILDNTLIRRIHKQHFDPDAVSGTQHFSLTSNEPVVFVIKRAELPKQIPANWVVKTIDDQKVEVHMQGTSELRSERLRKLEVSSAGLLPTGFDPSEHYPSRFHPKGLQLTILGASDALFSMGIEWDEVLKQIKPDELAVYAASTFGQVDDFGLNGYFQARLKDKRPTSKQLAFSLNTMPADFINAYMCGSVGCTGAMTGACATFLYNLRLAVDDIKSGRHRVVICGSAEAPVIPEIIEGFAAMSALGTDAKLAALDASEECDHRRASRPFGENAGFTLGESSQFFVLMDDALALELGADIHGAVTDVFINADGYKKSISSPGAGNYVTMAKAVAATQAIVGEKTVRERSFVQAHGSSTPQNRITESMIFDKVASNFSLKNWPVTAVKAFMGHSIGPASGDQLSNALGTFAQGIISGIKTVDKVADDVHHDHLDIVLEDRDAQMDVAFLNSKGFGGNNATAAVISPNLVEAMLAKRYNSEQMQGYFAKRESTREIAKQYDARASQGQLGVIYRFGEGVVEDHQITLSDDDLVIEGHHNSINLQFTNPYADMVE